MLNDHEIQSIIARVRGRVAAAQGPGSEGKALRAADDVGAAAALLGDGIHSSIDADNTDGGGSVVAVDAVGAGVGEVVMYASGSSARQTQVTQNRPCDAVIMAIVDTWEVDGTTVYVK